MWAYTLIDPTERDMVARFKSCYWFRTKHQAEAFSRKLSKVYPGVKLRVLRIVMPEGTSTLHTWNTGGGGWNWDWNCDKDFQRRILKVAVVYRTIIEYPYK